MEAAYALLVEAWVGTGTPLVFAFDKVEETLGLREAEQDPAVVKGQAMAQTNADSLAQLNMMMGSVGR